MELYCIDVGKVVSGTGILLNVLGIYKLYLIDKVALKINSLCDQDETPDFNQPIHIILNNFKGKENEELTKDEMEANYIEHLQSAKIDFIKFKHGFLYILIGSVLQFLSLFISWCI
ncbi:hypothetical protein ATO12_17210 [Aquimarina atlantica]|uniref:Uncharacterized protein n=1 Tax=Aquimarina atlantica TaxID=1317122 RepID=A0A023BUN2_9FLAO|nr:hypothetical protein [Aquimarina atlantica]EZH73675.1 hypothetical protein ATO12_17210 [Aquimarina atlantica]